MAEDEIKLEIKERLEIARRRLKAASLLLRNSMLDDASNRIYYGVFSAAKAMLNSIGSNPKTHSGLLTEFGLRAVKTNLVAKTYGSTLRKAFEMRESSDYEIGAELGKEEVETLLKEAEGFVTMAEKFVKERI